MEVIEPTSHVIQENSQLRLRCRTIMGNPSQLNTVQWYHNNRHFLSTISLKQLQQQSLQSGSISSTPSFHLYHRIGSGKHFTLIDDTTSLIGPIDGELLLLNNQSITEPFVRYSDTPDLLTVSNVSRIHAGNYSCLGFNGAANSSQLSPVKFISVKC